MAIVESDEWMAGVVLVLVGSLLSNISHVYLTVQQPSFDSSHDKLFHTQQRGFSLKRELLGWLGLFLGLVLQLSSLVFSSQSLLVSLSSILGISHLLLSSYLLDRRTSLKNISSLLLIAIGCILCIAFGQRQSLGFEPKNIPDAFLDYIFGGCLVVLFFTFVVCVMLYAMYSDTYSFAKSKLGFKKYIFIYCIIVGMVRGLALVFAKNLIAIEDDVNIGHPSTYFISSMFAFFGVSTLYFYRDANTRFQPVVVEPITSVTTVFYGTFLGGLYFEEYEDKSVRDIIIFCGGTLLCMVGLLFSIPPGSSFVPRKLAATIARMQPSTGPRKRICVSLPALPEFGDYETRSTSDSVVSHLQHGSTSQLLPKRSHTLSTQTQAKSSSVKSRPTNSNNADNSAIIPSCSDQGNLQEISIVGAGVGGEESKPVMFKKETTEIATEGKIITRDPQSRGFQSKAPHVTHTIPIERPPTKPEPKHHPGRHKMQQTASHQISFQTNQSAIMRPDIPSSQDVSVATVEASFLQNHSVATLANIPRPPTTASHTSATHATASHTSASHTSASHASATHTSASHATASHATASHTSASHASATHTSASHATASHTSATHTSATHTSASHATASHTSATHTSTSQRHRQKPHTQGVDQQQQQVPRAPRFTSQNTSHVTYRSAPSHHTHPGPMPSFFSSASSLHTVPRLRSMRPPLMMTPSEATQSLRTPSQLLLH